MSTAFLLFCIVPVILCFIYMHQEYLEYLLRDVSLHFQKTHESFDYHILINKSSLSTLVFPIPSLDMSVSKHTENQDINASYSQCYSFTSEVWTTFTKKKAKAITESVNFILSTAIYFDWLLDLDTQSTIWECTMSILQCK